jgi:ribonucleoside-diphosphate reductase alpha chain
LLLLNLLGYVKNPWTKQAEFDFESFYRGAGIAQRLMDDLIDLELEKIDAILAKINSDPEEDRLKYVERATWQGIRGACAHGRRTGCGITALGDCLAALGIAYGSEEAISFVDQAYRTLKLGCYRSSVDMARELGPFPLYDPEREKNCAFIQRIAQEDPSLYKDMTLYGRRNISLLTTSPAGSVSLLTKTTSGIEPLFAVSHKRRKKINPEDKNSHVDFVDENSGDCFQEFTVFHPQFTEWAKAMGHEKHDEKIIPQSPWYKNCAEDLNWSLRVKLQATANKHVDHAISSTINLPKDITASEVGKIYVEAWKSGCKGITVYVKDCRCGVLVDDEKETVKRDLPKIQKTQAPKRPTDLPAEIYHVTVKGKKYYVIVGMYQGEPYEVFAGENGQISNEVKKGVISKVKRGHYKAVFDNGEAMANIAENNNAEEEALTRLTSCSLRHGADISFVVHQLEKTKGDLMSFSKAMARVLKKFIVDGTVVTGESCPNCQTGKYLVRENGCVTCKSCGWVKCS